VIVMEEKKIVIAGELLTEQRKRLGSHTFLRSGKIYSDTIGMVKEETDTIAVVALEGCYTAEPNDLIVGVIKDEKFSGYTTDINHFTHAFVSKDEIRDRVKSGSIISAKVVEINELNEVSLANVRVFYGGEILKVSPVKVPRIIGKNGSMLEVLKRGTGTAMIVGRNGYVWLNGGNAELAIKAIRKIEKEAHLNHLTEKMTAYLQKENPNARFPSPAEQAKEAAGNVEEEESELIDG